MKATLRKAFDETSKGYSPDRVVADPALNCEFLAACRRHGLAADDATLNRALLNLRKRGALRGLKSKKSSFPNQDSYRFAAEMAARFLERRDGISLDGIICDPAIAAEFDTLAARLSPGFSSAEYRWAALNLRKSKRLKPEILSRVVASTTVAVFGITGLDVTKIPSAPGLYLLFTPECVLYIGEAENLNQRIRKHLDHSDNKGFARWLWDQGAEELQLEVHVLLADVPTRIRRALETELIRSRNPSFNIKR